MTKKERIWELDAFRGLCILAMVVIHLIYDLVELLGLVSWDYPPVVVFVQSWGGVLFLLLSGICVTLGSRCIRRGVSVFLCGMLCTLVTWGMYRLGFADGSILIYFGVLHCLGTCMILWPLFRRLPPWALATLGLALAVIGFVLRVFGTGCFWTVPLGLTPADFASSDYFPLLPNLGFFLLGAFLGKTLYAAKTTRFPNVNPQIWGIRFLSACGRQSLLIYLLHQPILVGILSLIAVLRQ